MVKKIDLRFGNYIRKRRLELGLTQQDVAKRAGVTQNFIAYLESNQRKAPTRLVKRLAEILTLPIDRLYLAARPEIEDFIEVDKDRASAKLRWPPALVSLSLDEDLRAQHQVSDADLSTLASIKARGEVRKKEDYIFLLMSIRQVMK